MGIKRGAAKITRLKAVYEELYPGEPHGIPSAAEMNIVKLCGGGMATSDNCSPAMKVKRLLVVAAQEAVKHQHTEAEWDSFSDAERAAKLLVLQGDCWNHLRNVWLGKMSNGITEHLKLRLQDDLEAIDFRLRVGTSFDGVLRACDKEFSLCANYPKGHGDMFKEWAQRCYPKALLFHVVSTSGGRQDMCCEGAGAYYMNRLYWAEFLDERLRVPGMDNILQESLYITMTSVDMVASSRIHSIIHLSIVIPNRWLAGNSHTLAEYNWSERSMGITVDLLERAMSKVIAGDDQNAPGGLLLDQLFMFSIFDEIRAQLPPFAKYLTYMYESKSMALAGSSMVEYQYARLRDELFRPTKEDNIASTSIALELAVPAAQDVLDELGDPKKATSRHLTSADGALSWGKTTLEEHEAAKRKMAVNDPAESSFGATTREIHCSGRVGLGNAGALAAGRRNHGQRDLPTESRKSCKSSESCPSPSLGIFGGVTPHMQEALLTMAARGRARRTGRSRSRAG